MLVNKLQLHTQKKRLFVRFPVDLDRWQNCIVDHFVICKSEKICFNFLFRRTTSYQLTSMFHLNKMVKWHLNWNFAMRILLIVAVDSCNGMPSSVFMLFLLHAVHVPILLIISIKRFPLFLALILFLQLSKLHAQQISS